MTLVTSRPVRSAAESARRALIDVAAGHDRVRAVLARGRGRS